MSEICGMCFKESERCVVVATDDGDSTWVCQQCVNVEIGNLNEENERLKKVAEAAREAFHKFSTMEWRRSENSESTCVHRPSWKDFNFNYMGAIYKALRDLDE